MLYKEDVPDDVWKLPDRLMDVNISNKQENEAEKNPEKYSVNINFVFSQIFQFFQDLGNNLNEMVDALDALIRYLKYYKLKRLPIFYNLDIPHIMQELLIIQPTDYSAIPGGFDNAVSIISLALLFIHRLFEKKQITILEDVLTDECINHLKQLSENVLPNSELAEIFITVLHLISNEYEIHTCDFIMEIASPDFILNHIQGTSITKERLCGLLHNFTKFNDSKLFNNDIIETIEKIIPYINDEEDINAKKEIILAIKGTGTVVYKNTSPEYLKFEMSYWLSLIIEKKLQEYGLSLMVSEDHSCVDVSCQFFVFLCQTTDYDDYLINDYHLILGLLSSNDDFKLTTGYEMLSEVAAEKPEFAIVISQNEDIMNIALETIEESPQRLKEQIGYFFCNLMKNCGENFMEKLAETNVFSSLLDLFGCSDENFCIAFAYSILKAFTRIENQDLRQHLIQIFIDEGGVEEFEKVQNNDGDLPDYTEEFLAIFIDQEKELSD